MDYRIAVTISAKRDLREIVRYISADSPQRGAAFGNRLLAAAGRLSQYPERGRVVPEIGDPLIREIIFQSYRIIYLVDDGARTISILRFWHAARGEPRLEP